MTHDPSPAAQAESHWQRLLALQETVLRETPCRECSHCHHWLARFAGASIPVGWCDFQEQPLDAGDLNSTQWDMCGFDLMEEAES